MAKIITDNQHYTDIAAAIRTKNETETQYKPSEMADAILAIQGGVELNFTVVGGATEPENPKENMVWINTDQEITGWAFSADEPENPAEGMVWIETAAFSSIEFDVLKENCVMVYPIAAQVYISGAWVKSGLKIFQIGAWKEGKFFIAPNENISWINSSADVMKTSTSTKITHTTSTPTNGTQAASTSYVDFDIAEAHTVLYVKCTHSMSASSGSDQPWQLDLVNTSGSTVSSIFSRPCPANQSHPSATYEKQIDVSALSGTYRLRSLCYTWASAARMHYVTITSCYLH